MQKRWLLLILLAGAGTSLWSIVPALSSLLLGLAPVLCIVFYMEALFQMKGFDRQRLLVALPVPKGTPLKTVPLLLGDEDVKVYCYLIRHGGRKARGNGREVCIKYSGSTIYHQKTNTFIIDDEKHVPEDIRVRELNWFGI